MHLSKNFVLSEITSLEESSLSNLQMLMLKNICEEILEPIREFCSSRIKIRSGMRTLHDYVRLKDQGYHPSETSDHFFGTPITLSNSDKIKKYGKVYLFSVGAVDIEFLDTKTEEAFLKILSRREKFKVGQIILEKMNSFWIHISNPPTLVFSDRVFTNLLYRQKYLYSLDGGRSYHNAIEYISNGGRFK